MPLRKPLCFPPAALPLESGDETDPHSGRARRNLSREDKRPMTFDVKENSARFKASIQDLKLVYRVLHRHLGENLDLMDCDFFDALQSALQQKAQAARRTQEGKTDRPTTCHKCGSDEHLQAN